MKVTIITPCYNSAQYIGGTIHSVQQQTISDWELIVVDDGSTDNSASIIIPFLSDFQKGILLVWIKFIMK